MAESKKREFSRAIAQKRCLEAIDRAILINEGKAERPFLYTVNELVVFGSLVSSEKSKVHDVDLFVTWKQKLDFQDDYKAADKAWQDYTRKYAPDSLWNDWYKVQSFPQTDVMRYLRGRSSGLISLHGELDRIYVDGGVNYTVIRDGKVQKVALDALTRRFETA
jgi:predicted nucleotidyltransferase